VLRVLRPEWWASVKVAAMLAAALAASLYLNYWQHRRAITAPLRDQVHGLERALEDSQALQDAVRDSTARLSEAAETTASALTGAARDSRRAIAGRPITDPQCAPGKDRMDAANRALGAPQRGKQ